YAIKGHEDRRLRLRTALSRNLRKGIIMSDAELARAYYLDFAAALVRHRMPELQGTPAELFRRGLEAGLRLHHFKRTAGLPRVRKVLGILRGLATTEVLDLGSGRGVFLWPLLDTF